MVMNFLHDQNCSTRLPSAKSPCTARRTYCLPHGRGPYGPPFFFFNFLLCSLVHQVRTHSNSHVQLGAWRIRRIRFTNPGHVLPTSTSSSSASREPVARGSTVARIARYYIVTRPPSTAIVSTFKLNEINAEEGNMYAWSTTGILCSSDQLPS